jgi:D-glycero-D-manno-heptose 1,7-bisphosphate phosphatase
MVTVYTNRDAFTRNNVFVDNEGYIVNYDRSRSSPGLNGVEIGYAMLNRDVLDYVPDGNPSFEACVYPYLVKNRLLQAFMAEHRYYSIGSLERLSQTREFLLSSPAIILDRDGVINKKPSRARYVRKWEEFEWLPGSVEALRLLKNAGYKVIVVTNQAGVARGEMTESDLISIHDRMQSELAQVDASVEAIYYCSHNWNEGCFCRKPEPGLLFQAQREYNLDLTKTFFIGDDERDMEAGFKAGCPTLRVSTEFTLLRCVEQNVSLINRDRKHLS